MSVVGCRPGHSEVRGTVEPEAGHAAASCTTAGSALVPLNGSTSGQVRGTYGTTQWWHVHADNRSHPLAMIVVCRQA